MYVEQDMRKLKNVYNLGINKIKIEQLKFKLGGYKFALTNYFFLLATIIIIISPKSTIELLMKTNPFHITIMILIWIPILYCYIKIWHLRKEINKIYYLL